MTIIPNINEIIKAIECITSVEILLEKKGILLKMTYPIIQYPYVE